MSPINDIAYIYGCHLHLCTCMKMKCFHSSCEKKGEVEFTCQCNERKMSCMAHKCFIKHSKYSCLLAWKCCRCFVKRGIGKCKLIPVQCFGVTFHICGQCAIKMMNDLLFEDKLPQRAQPYQQCDDCQEEIEPIKRPYSISVTVGNGWCWEVCNAKYNYCSNCLSYQCEKLMK